MLIKDKRTIFENLLPFTFFDYFYLVKLMGLKRVHAEGMTIIYNLFPFRIIRGLHVFKSLIPPFSSQQTSHCCPYFLIYCFFIIIIFTHTVPWHFRPLCVFNEIIFIIAHSPVCHLLNNFYKNQIFWIQKTIKRNIN